MKNSDDDDDDDDSRTQLRINSTCNSLIDFSNFHLSYVLFILCLLVIFLKLCLLICLFLKLNF